eukprot:SM009432S25045  [mRNA]  locus=s9432:179:426:- [translate_table: standard]
MLGAGGSAPGRRRRWRHSFAGQQLSVAAAAAAARSRHGARRSLPPVRAGSIAVGDVSETTFEDDVLGADRPVLVDFWAT